MTQASPIQSDQSAFAPTTPVPAPERIGVLTGSRACHVCHFNLSGQPIIREPHYKLTTVQCPECGTMAALAEYPILSSWSRRAGSLLAAVWVLAVIGLLVISGITVVSCSYQTLDSSLAASATMIAEAFIEHTKILAAGVNGTQWQNYSQQPASPMMWIEQAWWEAERGKLVASGAVAIRTQLTEQTVWMWLLSIFAIFPLGVIQACVLLQLRGWRLLLQALLFILLVAGAFWVINKQSNVFVSWNPQWLTAAQAAKELVPEHVVIGIIALHAAALFAGILLGRRCGRLLVRWLVHPRMHVFFGGLWLADGLTYPSQPPPTGQRRAPIEPSR